MQEMAEQAVANRLPDTDGKFIGPRYRAIE